MNYLLIKNWKKFQHYGDGRNPPWIKLHRSLLTDYDFHQLSDATKAHLMLIWLYASQTAGRVPDDAAFLRMKLGVASEIDVAAMKARGFLIPASADERLNKEEDVDKDKTLNRERALANFASFWEAYPRKVAKQDALKAWRSLALGDAAVAKLMRALIAAKSGWVEPQFIPYPGTWLRGRRWEDEMFNVEPTAIQRRKLCAYCERDASGSVGGTWHCDAHSLDAMDQKPSKKGKA